VVTVSGLHLDSVAAPLISLTVVVTNVDGSSMPSTVRNFEVLIQHLLKLLLYLCVAKAIILIVMTPENVPWGNDLAILFSCGPHVHLSQKRRRRR